MFLAVELNEDKTVNDTGSIEATPEEAWEKVKSVFHAPSTVIVYCKPVSAIKTKTSLTPLPDLDL